MSPTRPRRTRATSRSALKVGVIGIGGIASTHFPGWRESPHAELVAVADIDENILHHVADEQAIDRRYLTGYDLIEDPDIDIVDICVPNMYHRPLAIAALEAGKHVLCEKPLAPTPDDVRALIDARDLSGKLLMTAQHFRFSGAARALRAEVERGILGDIYHARAWMLRRAAAPVRTGFTLREHSGGGPCIDIGVHILDLTLWMMGHPKPVSVTGITHDKLRKQPGAFSIWGGAIPPEWNVEEMAAALIRFANGATLVLEVSWMLHHKTDVEDMQMWLYGEKAGCHWPSNVFHWSDNETRQHKDMSLALKDGGEPHALECMAFAEAVAMGRPAPVPPEDSLSLITILDALYKSARTGREVRM